MNSRKTRPCPECGKVVADYIEHSGFGTTKLRIKCPYCLVEKKDIFVEIEIGSKTYVIATKLIFPVVFAVALSYFFYKANMVAMIAY